MVPVEFTHRCRVHRSSAVQEDFDTRLRARRKRIQDVKVLGERHRPANGDRGRKEPKDRAWIWRRYLTTVGGEHGLHG